MSQILKLLNYFVRPALTIISCFDELPRILHNNNSVPSLLPASERSRLARCTLCMKSASAASWRLAGLRPSAVFRMASKVFRPPPSSVVGVSPSRNSGCGGRLRWAPRQRKGKRQVGPDMQRRQDSCRATITSSPGTITNEGRMRHSS